MTQPRMLPCKFALSLFAVYALLWFVTQGSAYGQVTNDAEPASSASAVLTQEPQASRTPEAKVEYIHVEGRAQIDELRVRGETQRIEVTPQANMPRYEIIPETGTQPSGKNSTSGQRVWRIFNF